MLSILRNRYLNQCSVRIKKPKPKCTGIRSMQVCISLNNVAKKKLKQYRFQVRLSLTLASIYMVGWCCCLVSSRGSVLMNIPWTIPIRPRYIGRGNGIMRHKARIESRIPQYINVCLSWGDGGSCHEIRINPPLSVPTTSSHTSLSHSLTNKNKEYTTRLLYSLQQQLKYQQQQQKETVENEAHRPSSRSVA